MNVTLEEHCRHDRCKLFFTKRDSTPKQYEALLEAAVRMKEASLSSFAMDSDEVPMTIWEREALIVFERADRIFENERAEKDKDENDKTKKKRHFNPGTSSAFKYSDEQLRQMYIDRNKQKERKPPPKKRSLEERGFFFEKEKEK